MRGRIPNCASPLRVRPAGSRLTPVKYIPAVHRCNSQSQKRTYASVHASKLRFGQPLHETHPHILKAGELTPGITALEYYNRRCSLAQLLPEGSITISKAAELKYRSHPVFYDFHQDSNFSYLTGWAEAGAVGIIEKTGPEDEHRFYMFVKEKNKQEELWDGPRNGVAAAEDVFNADEAHDIEKLPDLLPKILSRAETIYTDIVAGPPLQQSKIFFGNAKPPMTETFASQLSKFKTRPLKTFLHRLRVIKSPAEIANMREAGRISGRVFNKAMGTRFTKEKDLWAFLDYGFRVGGCEKEAYVPVVAGGRNALSIHYTRNEDILREGETVLVDAGGQYSSYVTDITRTFPISGKFSDPQRDIYQIVLDSQKECIKLCTEESQVTLNDLHSVAQDALIKGLRRLSPPIYASDSDMVNILFPHHVGHYLGLDVHDCPTFSRNTKLTQRMCITIEPGIYVPDSENFPKPYRELAVRIEDSICIGKKTGGEEGESTGGPVVLSVEAVKEVVDVEALGERHRDG